VFPHFQQCHKLRVSPELIAFILHPAISPGSYCYPATLSCLSLARAPTTCTSSCPTKFEVWSPPKFLSLVVHGRTYGH
jgi:hypothetical protein